jgi:serine/threonine protein kinase
MANSMDGLYKKVLKGQYSRIPHSFSHTLEKFIGKCLQQDPKNRPTAK